jgi:uncharacterized protein YdeI (YjbR/CyaY-like superfamily)
MPKNLDPRIDDYIAKAAPFAQPILKQLRALVHRACPAAQETLKWSMPHFTYNDKILCSMAAFKAHCAFGFWHQGMERELGASAKSDEAMGLLGRITSRSDLPSDAIMIGYIKRAADLHDSGTPARPPKKAKPEIAPPADLLAALKKNKAAATAFENFSPSHRREYVEWIVEAKRDETRQKRLATTLEWLAEGKSRHWKYTNC